MQLVGQQLLGEPTRKVHQVIGRDGTGEENGHGINHLSAKNGRPGHSLGAASAKDARRSRCGVEASRRRSYRRRNRHRRSVVDLEALLLDGVGVGDGGTCEQRHTGPVDHERNRARALDRLVDGDVAVEGALIEESWYCMPAQPPGCTAIRRRRSSRPSPSSSSRTFRAAASDSATGAPTAVSAVVMEISVAVMWSPNSRCERGAQQSSQLYILPTPRLRRQTASAIVRRGAPDIS